MIVITVTKWMKMCPSIIDIQKKKFFDYLKITEIP